jgi:hypothetical protein
MRIKLFCALRPLFAVGAGANGFAAADDFAIVPYDPLMFNACSAGVVVL